MEHRSTAYLAVFLVVGMMATMFVMSHAYSRIPGLEFQLSRG
jgi:hypothetical protein